MSEETTYVTDAAALAVAGATGRAYAIQLVEISFTAILPAS